MVRLPSSTIGSLAFVLFAITATVGAFPGARFLNARHSGILDPRTPTSTHGGAPNARGVGNPMNIRSSPSPTPSASPPDGPPSPTPSASPPDGPCEPTDCSHTMAGLALKFSITLDNCNAITAQGLNTAFRQLNRLPTGWRADTIDERPYNAFYYTTATVDISALDEPSDIMNQALKKAGFLTSHDSPILCHNAGD